ncbi:MAG: hypothetical protein JOZ15_10165, partial [Acidobacteria bacterium]|nr:hypothetical protein [Acidobacteriota bacterium]
MAQTTQADRDPQATAAAGTAPAAPTAWWLLVGPDDEVSRRLAARLGMTPPSPGGHRFVPAAKNAYPAALAAGAPWDAVAYRPPRQGGFPGRPDLADAEAFFAAFAQAASGGGRAGERPPRLVLVSSAAAVSPSHHHPGCAAESER